LREGHGTVGELDKLVEAKAIFEERWVD